MYNLDKIHKNYPFKKTNVEMNVLRVLTYDEIKDMKTNTIGDIVYNEIQNKINLRMGER